jgi:hypothetical protein
VNTPAGSTLAPRRSPSKGDSADGIRAADRDARRGPSGAMTAARDP